MGSRTALVSRAVFLVGAGLLASAPAAAGPLDDADLAVAVPPIVLPPPPIVLPPLPSAPETVSSLPLPILPAPELVTVASEPTALLPTASDGLTTPGVVLEGAASGVTGVSATVLEASRVVLSPTPAGVATSDADRARAQIAAAPFGAPDPCPGPASGACTVARPRPSGAALQGVPTSSGGSGGGGDGGIFGGGLAGTGARVGLLAAAGALLVWAGQPLARLRRRAA